MKVDGNKIYQGKKQGHSFAFTFIITIVLMFDCFIFEKIKNPRT